MAELSTPTADDLLVYLLLGVALFRPWLDGVSLLRDADVALDVTFDPGAEVTGVGQHRPLVDELVTCVGRERETSKPSPSDAAAADASY